MVRIDRRLKRSFFSRTLLFAIIFSIIFSSTVFCEDTPLSQAEALFKAKKFEEAKAIYQSLTQDSDSSVAINGLTGVGRCEIQLGNTAVAEQLIGTLKSSYSQHPELCSSLCRLSYEYWYVKNYDKSLDHSTYIVQTFPNNPAAKNA